MQTAPPVSVRGTGGLLWLAVQLALPAAAAASITAWAVAFGLDRAAVTPTDAVPWLPLAVLSAAAAAGMAAWLAARSLRPAELAWDGQQWRLDGAAGAVVVMLDLGGWLLLLFSPEVKGKRLWRAFAVGEAGAAWHGLRTAVHARVPLPVAPPVSVR